MNQKPIAQFAPAQISRISDWFVLELFPDLLVAKAPEKGAKFGSGKQIPFEPPMEFPIGSLDYQFKAGGMFGRDSLTLVDKSGRTLPFVIQYESRDKQELLAFLDEVEREAARQISDMKAQRTEARPARARGNADVSEHDERDNDLAGQIGRLAALHAEGDLTDEEFAAAKSHLLK